MESHRNEFQIGILGGGQLARMSMMAAQRMGLKAISLDEDSQSPAAQVGQFQLGSIHNPESIAQLMARCEKITFENEFIRGSTIREACHIAKFDQADVIPGIECLETIQDKLTQRQAYERAGVPSPKAVSAMRASELGFPCVLKARYGGYDGKGTIFINSPEEFEALKSQKELSDWLAEEKVKFVSELAVMVVSTVPTTQSHSRFLTFPAMVTEQKNYVCDLVYPLSDKNIQKRAEEVAISAVKAVGGVGLFGVELFLTESGDILVNEMAPRPHNSGHYTLDWGGISQFEAHMTTVAGLISYITHGSPTCMANILGCDGANDYLNGLSKVIKQHPEARMQWYGKAISKPGRKMGHLNVVSPYQESATTVIEELKTKAIAARDTFFEGWTQPTNSNQGEKN